MARVRTGRKLRKLADLGMSFKSDTLMVHFLMACGRDETDDTQKVLADRREATAREMDRLSATLKPARA